MQWQLYGPWNFIPKIAQEMTALQVARLKEAGDHQVGGVPGLLLRIDGNSRAWVLRIVVDGKRRSLGIGPYPQVTLSMARDKAREKRNQVDDGEAILVTKAEARKIRLTSVAKAVTFKDVALAMLAAKRVTWSNPKHAAQWANTLETYAYPKLGHVAVVARLVSTKQQAIPANAIPVVLGSGIQGTSNVDCP